MKSFIKDKLTVKIMPTREEMGKVSAKDIHDRIVDLLSKKDEINMIFAAAPSQNDVLKSLAECSDIDWSRINAFHMDEYVGLTKKAPQCFSNFLMDHIFSLVPFKSINLIDCEAEDAEKECERYAELLKPYEHSKLVDVPLHIIREADQCLKDARRADREWDLCMQRLGD
jgi:glucosamine-6-phosphate deaminase